METEVVCVGLCKFEEAYFTSYGFQDSSGIARYRETYGHSLPYGVPGEPVTVFYDAAAPKRSMLPDEMEHLGVAMSALVLLLFIEVAFLALFAIN